MMTRVFAVLSIVILLAGCRTREPIHPMTGGAIEQDVADDPNLMSVAEIEAILRKAKARGQSTIACTGRSVFEGTKIETFEAEVIDVIRHFIGPKRHVILARLKPTHPVVAKAGVIQGMSGSPMYINDRLVGALAYGWFWAKEPLIGITPIHDMIADAKRKSPDLSRNLHEGAKSEFAPVRTPLFVSGLSARGVERLKKELEPWPINVMLSGKGSAVHDAPGPFEPGSAIGATLATGDVDFTGIGTVTHVEDDLIIAFGHPFFGDGAVDMPITTAVVHTVFAGMSNSFKIASPVDTVGALVQDRTACIAGIMGRKSRLVPVHITLHDAAEEMTQELNVKIVENPTWLPMILNMASFMAEDTYAQSSRPRTVVSDFTVKLSNGQSLEFRQINVTNPEGGVGSARAGANTIGRVLQILRNPYEKVGIKSIDVRHEYIAGMRSAGIRKAWALTKEVAPGGTARVRLVLQHYRKEETTLDVEIPLPPEVESGEEVSIEIAGAPAASRLIPPYHSLDEMIEVLKEDIPATHVVSTIYLSKFTFLYRGKKLERLPGSVIAQMIPGLDKNAAVANTPVRVTRDVGKVILGSARVTVKVR